jgi:hypothetical protein
VRHTSSIMETNKSDVDKKLLHQIHDLRFEAIFREIKNLLEKENVPLILLKGPYLAHTVYEHPSERAYIDLDILVKPGDFKKAARVLLENQFTLLEEDDKNLATTAQTNHWAFRSRLGQLIELHRGFTGLERHPSDLAEWFARAEAFKFGQTPALGLETEDLLCHLCLHIGKSFFYLIEQKHIQDLNALIRKRTIKWDAFFQRCQETRSKAIAFYCLHSAKAQYGTPIPDGVSSALRPGKWRRFWLDKHLDVTAFPIYRFHARGASHARRRLTLPLLDGVWNWGPFLVKAMAVKGMDVVLRIPVLRRMWKRRFDVRRSKFEVEERETIKVKGKSKKVKVKEENSKCSP